MFDLPPSALQRPIVVGLSGGVDSSVAALLLKQAGAEVRAVFMKNWEEDDRDGHCSATEDLADARRVAQSLDLPLQAVNFSHEYWERVFETFLSELRAGRTPNPDVLCNREVKFRAFLDHAIDRGAGFIATGHYARIRRGDTGVELLKGLDPGKDQSYFLCMLGQEALTRTLFPIGELPKSEVRRLAAQAGLATHAKKDSTGICFIGERNFPQFLSRYLQRDPGPMVTLDKLTLDKATSDKATLDKASSDGGDYRRIGEHRGLPFYTIGQRQGLGLGGGHGGDQRGDRRDSGKPWYVAGKDPASNTLIVVQGHDHPALYSMSLRADQAHWVAGRPPSLPLACRAKTRYRQQDQACTVSAAGHGRLRVDFAEPQWAVTPGQSVVFYQGPVCLGGAIIDIAATGHRHAPSPPIEESP